MNSLLLIDFKTFQLTTSVWVTTDFLLHKLFSRSKESG